MSEVSLTFPLTSYVVPQPEAFNLMSRNTSKVEWSGAALACTVEGLPVNAVLCVCRRAEGTGPPHTGTRDSTSRW